LRQAEQGDVDLIFHTREGAPPALHQRLLFTERYVLAGRLNHPALKRRPTLAQFCRLEHVIVSPEGGGFSAITDEVLAKVGFHGASCSLCHISCLCWRRWPPATW
jgi:DNA-binding transcriptional LysR family regulator